MGLNEFDFWNMTVAEVERYLNGAVWRHKTQAQFDYTLATLIGRAVSCVVSGGEMATLEEAYPSLFDAPNQEEEKEEREKEKRITNSVNRFLAFAKQHNAKKMKGVNNE